MNRWLLSIVLFYVCCTGLFHYSSGQSFLVSVADETEEEINNKICETVNGTKVGWWSCDNGVSIPCPAVCNGGVHCDDGSDETAQSCLDLDCPDTYFRCSYGACIPSESQCDGSKDCLDGSDETESACLYNICPDDTFRCSYGACVEARFKCDGWKDCLDGSDETAVTCRDTVCPETSFRCSYGGCTFAENECDEVEHCADGSDEKTLNCPGIIDEIRGNCSEGFFQCKSGDCIDHDNLCNGASDCKDSSDETEEECAANFCPDIAFQCDYGACVLALSRCNGKQECADGSDEKPEICPQKNTTTTQRPPVVLPSMRPSPTSRPSPSFSVFDFSDPSQPPALPGGGGVSSWDTFFLRVKSTIATDQMDIYTLRRAYYDLQLEMWRYQIQSTAYIAELSRSCGMGFSNRAPQMPSLANSFVREADAPVRSTVEAPPMTSGAVSGCPVPVLEGGRVMDERGVTIDSPKVGDGEWIYFECSARDSMRGGQNGTFCMGETGQFMHAIPTCAKPCNGVKLNTLSVQGECFLQDGTKISCTQQVPPRSVAILSCKVGYKRPDRTLPDAFICMDNGKWDAHIYRCLPICGEVAEGRQLIVGGRDSNITQVPWHAGIYETISSKMEQICGGSILNPTAIVTAAHCFWDLQRKATKDAELYGVAVGKTLRDFDAVEPTSQKYGVASIKIYDQYRDYEGLFVADIAVVRLKKPIIFQSYIKPICVEFGLKGNQRYVVSGITGRVAGWGLTASDGDPSPILKAIDLPTVDFNTCLNESPESFKPFITSDKFCGGFTSGESVCRGDSGGGLAFPKMSGEKTVYFLRGIVSVGPILRGSCDNSKYSAFTDIQLHDLFLYDFILN